MTLYEQLYTISWSMLQMSQQEDWDSFIQANSEREQILQIIESDKDSHAVSESLLKKIIAIHKELEKVAVHQKMVAKESLVGIHKSKKINQVYQSQ